MVFTSISVNIKTATVFWLILFVLFYFLCWVVWACVSFLNVMYLVFRLQRNCIFCTTRYAIGILAACSAVQNQRLTLVLTVASLGSTWDLPWIGNNRRPFIFFRLVFVSYCLVRWECKLWWRIRKISFSRFVVAVYFLHYSDDGRSCHRALCHLYVLIIRSQLNLELPSIAAAFILMYACYTRLFL